MPTFKVTSPDGKVYQGTAPEGATQDDILAYVQKQVMTANPMSSVEKISASLPNKEPMPKEQYDRAMWESNPLMRAVRGVEGPAIKAMELAGADSVKDIAEARKRGMGIRYGDEQATDWAGMAGAMAPGAAMVSGITQAVGPATALGRIGTNALSGGVVSGAQPGSTMGDVAGGAAAGGALTGLFELGRAGKDMIARNVSTPEFVKHWYREKIGEKWLPEAKRLLGSTDDPLATTTGGAVSYPATAAEKVAGSPAGTVIQEQQKVVARTPGGISSDFGERLMQQNQAIQQAGDIRNATTGPMRERALALANQGGVKSADVLDGLASIRKIPGLGASDVVDKSLSHLEKKVAALTDASGNINADALYTIRKELGNTISTFSKETQNWDKRLTAKVQADIQKGIDWAINNGINRGSLSSGAAPASTSPWDAYLAEHASRSKAIEDVLAAQKAQYKPIQRTTIPGSANQGPEEVKHILPNWLNSKVTGTRWLVDAIARRMEPKIDALQSDIMRNPDKFAAMLDDVPYRYRPIVDAMVAQGLAQGAAANVRSRQ